MVTPVRVAHLVAHPIQYFAPLYRQLSARPEMDLTVYFYSNATTTEFYDAGFGRTVRWDTELLDGYRWKVLPSANRPATAGYLAKPNWDITRSMLRSGYEVVWAHGYAHPTTWLCLLAARARGARLLIREEQTLLHGRPWHKRLLKQIALRALFGVSSGLYIGEQNRRYFQHYGMPDERLFPARYCVDNVFFRERADELAASRAALRASFGVTDDAPVMLFCGKLVDKKRPLALIEAFAEVRRQQPCWLLLVGDGPLRAAAEELVRRDRIPGVLMAGFLNQTELPAAYTAADVFVLPSGMHETWGLVVNEAMNFSLPVIVSDKVGCGLDLVQDGWNGFTVSHRGTEDLATAMKTLAGDQALRRTFGARSRQLVERYSIEACAEGILTACLATARSPKQRDREGRPA
jgi:glycosyltransferase involved in cell wall biosynthesis